MIEGEHNCHNGLWDIIVPERPNEKLVHKPTIILQQHPMQVFMQKLLDIKDNRFSLLPPRDHQLQNNHQYHILENLEQ